MNFLRRGRFASVGAVMLSLALAPTAAATTWTPPQNLSTGTVADIVTSGNEAVAVYLVPTGDGEVGVDPAHLYIRRRILFMGSPVWLSAQRLAENAVWYEAGEPHAAASGNAVDIVYVTNGWRLAYLRSTDGGGNFTSPRRLSPKAHNVYEVDVARRGDLVVVAWYAWDFDATFVKVSTDGGETFGPAKEIAGESPSVAVGKGVIYVAFIGSGGLYVKRSFNNGGKWTPNTLLSATALGGHEWGEITAQGDSAYVAYESWASGEWPPTVRSRRTLDRGRTWGPASAIDTAAGALGWEPFIRYSGGALHAIWNRCADSSCDDANLYYSRRAGTSWIAAEFLTEFHYAATVGMADKVIVLFDAVDGVYYRIGTP